MLPFYIGLVVIFFGLGAVGRLMWNEKKNEGAQLEKKPASPPQREPITTNGLLNRLGLKHSTSEGSSSEKKSLLGFLTTKIGKETSPERPDTGVTPTLANINLDLPPKKEEAPATGTASLRIDAPNPQKTSLLPTNKNISSEAALSIKHDELQTQYNGLQAKLDKMEVLLTEKNATLEKSEKALANELKNRKEFNKIKDILERELRETKDNGKQLQINTNSAQMESESLRNRIRQLEEKVKETEKEVFMKEEGNKEIQSEIEKGKNRILALEKFIEEKDKKIAVLVKKLKEESPSAETGKEEIPPAEQSEPVPEGPTVPEQEKSAIPEEAEVKNEEPSSEQGKETAGQSADQTLTEPEPIENGGQEEVVQDQEKIETPDTPDTALSPNEEKPSEVPSEGTQREKSPAESKSQTTEPSLEETSPEEKIADEKISESGQKPIETEEKTGTPEQSEPPQGDTTEEQPQKNEEENDKDKNPFLDPRKILDLIKSGESGDVSHLSPDVSKNLPEENNAEENSEKHQEDSPVPETTDSSNALQEEPPKEKDPDQKEK